MTQTPAPAENFNGHAAGGYSATAGDMVRLMLATDKQSNHPDILAASSLTLMETPPFPATVPNRALGWDHSNGKLAKGGDIAGGNAYIAKFPAGYLLGAAHRGAAQTSGIHAELVRRLDAAARYSPADRALPAPFLRAYRRGFDAGRERGCMARRACPVGRDHLYPAAQARFHMEAFLNARRR